jgi:tyrosyl-tRNA synthetase
VGGFTCKIGDPSGRTSDRVKMSSQTAKDNIEKIRAQLQRLFSNVSEYTVLRGCKGNALGRFEVLDNQTWWEDMTISDFLKDVAQHMRLGPMLARER